MNRIKTRLTLSKAMTLPIQHLAYTELNQVTNSNVESIAKPEREYPLVHSPFVSINLIFGKWYKHFQCPLST